MPLYVPGSILVARNKQTNSLSSKRRYDPHISLAVSCIKIQNKESEGGIAISAIFYFQSNGTHSYHYHVTHIEVRKKSDSIIMDYSTMKSYTRENRIKP